MRPLGVGLLVMLFAPVSPLSPIPSARPAHADAFHCGSRLVKPGDSAETVIGKCGEPQTRAPLLETQCLPLTGCQSVQVGERWTYDFGPDRFMRHLSFRNQRLEAVQAGDYGHRR